MFSAILGLDIGTTSVSTVALDLSGNQVASFTIPHHAEDLSQPPNYHEQSPEKLWQTACAAVRQMLNASPELQPEAVGLTGQMHSTLLLNQQYRPVSQVLTWQDQRCLLPATNGQTCLERLLKSATAEAMHSTGCQLSPGYLGTTLFSLRQLNQWPQDAAHATFVADWIGSQLCGQPPVTDPSHAASSGLYDLQQHRWHPALLNAACVDVDWLPQVVASGQVIGQVSASAAAETGLPEGTRVCNAIGDNQASVLSSLPDDPLTLLINVGTGGQIVWRISKFVRLPGMDTRYLPLLESHSSIQHCQLMLVGAGLCGGDALAWINRTVRNWLQAFGVDRSEAEVWAALANQLAEIPGDMPPVECEPFFQGTRPEPNRRAVFRNVSGTNFLPANVARAILNGIAESMFAVYERAGEYRPEPLQQIVMSGNAARQNPLLVQAVQQRFGVSTQVAGCREEAATGAAMLALSQVRDTAC